MTRRVFELPVWVEYIQAYVKTIDQMMAVLERDSPWATFMTVKIIWDHEFDGYEVLKQLINYDYRLVMLQRYERYYANKRLDAERERFYNELRIAEQERVYAKTGSIPLHDRI